jgi:hypothetical protein
MNEDQDQQDQQATELVALRLELAELRIQNLNLGSQIVKLEAETISQRRRVVELEAQIALDQRSKMSEQIDKARGEAEADLDRRQRAAAETFGVELEGLTAAKLKTMGD